MKRLHVHMGVKNLDEGIRFYSSMFGAEPTKIKDDYAKWMLDDPQLNFAISTMSGNEGIDHLGIQVDDESELDELRNRIASSGGTAYDEGTAECCYALSDKSWVRDPSGVAWEAYRTMADIRTMKPRVKITDQGSCCEPSSGCC